MRVDGRIRWLAIAAVAGFGAAMVVMLASLVGLGDLTLAAPTAVIVATVVLMNHLTNDRLRRAGKRSQASLAAIERRTVSIATRVRGLEATIHEAGAMAVLSPTATPYPLPLGGNWALAWDAAVVLAREVGLARPSVVVELGSGARASSSASSSPRPAADTSTASTTNRRSQRSPGAISRRTTWRRG